MPDSLTAELDPDRSPWRALVDTAGGVDAATDLITEMVATVTGLLDDIAASPAAQSVLPAVRVDAARELSAAAARLHHSGTVLQVLAAGLVDEQQVHLRDHERSTRYWLARHNGITHRAASALVRASEARGRYELVDEAFVTGDITLGHLDAIAGIIPSRFRGERLDQAVEAISEIQSTLIDAAREHTVDRFAEFCARVRDRLDDDGDTDRTAEPSRVWLSQTFNGRWALKGDLSADDGALLATMLIDAMNHLANNLANNTANETASGETAETPDAPATDVPGSQPCESERRARALAQLMLAGSGATKPGRVGVYLHVELDDLNPAEEPDLDEILLDPHLPHTEAALDITMATLWALLADADVTPVFTTGGRTLSYGRTQRLAPFMLRRIVAHRDRTCRVPGCDRPAVALQCHHVQHWDDQGDTDPCNCMGACKFHHQAHHKRGLGIVGDAEDVLRFTRADGTPFDAEPAYLDRRRQQRADRRAHILRRLRAS